jgi:DNA-directed RNA polymerase I, II, and III subunit RPABC1
MAEIDEVAANKLFTIKKNQLKMVKRRGYIVEPQEEDILSVELEDFLSVYIPFAKQSKQSLRQILSRPYVNAKEEKLVVYYADEPTSTKKLGIEALGNAIVMCEKYNTKNLILITGVDLSSAASKEIEKMVSYNIYVFLENEMTYDPTEHYFTPAHRALSVEEQRNFLKVNNLSLDQFPIILTSDMISRYYGFRPGQVIEIRRNNLYDTIISTSLSYRAVKEDV